MSWWFEKSRAPSPRPTGGASRSLSLAPGVQALWAPRAPAPARGYFLPGAYAVILPPAESDEIMREGPARRKTSLSVSEPGNSIGF